MITSVTNARLKNIAKLLSSPRERRKQGLYVIEGPKLFLEACEAAGEKIREVYISESFAERLHERASDRGEPSGGVRDALLRTGYETVSDAAFKKISDTQTPQGILCAVEMPEVLPEAYFTSGDFARGLLLEEIQDPGNLGTMIRTAEAAGFDYILADQGTADYYNPKTIRSTMGSVFRMKLGYTEDLSGTVSSLKAAGVTVYAAHLLGENDYDKESYAKKTAILIGNEGKGLSPELTKLASRLVKIPMQGRTESLNAAVAAALLMYRCRPDRP